MLIAAGVVLVAVLLRVVTTTSWPLWDLDVYVAGAQAVMAGTDPYAIQAHGLVFTYPPFAAAAFVPLAGLGSAAGLVLTAVSIFAYAVGGLVVAHRVGLSRRWTVLVLVGGLVLEPIVRTLVLGQINLVLMALVLLDVFLVRGPARGVLIGVAAGLKLTPGVFVVYFLLKGDVRSALRAAAAFLVTVAVGWLVAPDASRSYWSGRIVGMDSFGDYQIQSPNQSVRGVLIRILGDADPPVGLWLAIALVVLVVGVAVARSFARLGDDVGSVLALATTGLLVSPISWTHHWVWAVPMLLYLVARGRAVLAWVTGVVLYLAPIWFLPMGGGVELRYAAWQVAISATYAAVLVAVFVTLLLRPRGGSPGQRRTPNQAAGGPA